LEKLEKKVKKNFFSDLEKIKKIKIFEFNENFHHENLFRFFSQFGKILPFIMKKKSSWKLFFGKNWPFASEFFEEIYFNNDLALSFSERKRTTELKD